MGRLTLVRHGQASFGDKNYDKLSKLGHLQSKILGNFFNQNDHTFDKFFCGTMSRQISTMQEIIPNCKPIILPGLNEYDSALLLQSNYGGNPPTDIFKDRKIFFKSIRTSLEKWQSGKVDIKGKSWHNFKEEVLAALQTLTCDPNSNVIAVTSGGPISLILTDILKAKSSSMIDLHLQIKNSSFTNIITTPKALYLSEFNSTAHLTNEKSSLVTYS